MSDETKNIQNRVFQVNTLRAHMKELETEKKNINQRIKQTRAQIVAIELELKEKTKGKYGKRKE